MSEEKKLIDATQHRKVTGGVLRLFGVNIPMSKKVRAALPILSGVGKKNVFDICNATGVSCDARVFELSEDEVASLKKYIEDSVKIEGDLRADNSSNIKRLVQIRCYRGLMHSKGLPVRGQRTKTNARTRKGKKKSFSSKGRK